MASGGGLESTSGKRRRGQCVESSNSRPAEEPEDPSVLYDYANHRAQQAHADAANTSTKDRQTIIRAGKMWDLDEMTQGYVDAAGFGYAATASRITVDQGLVRGMAERWHYETHTFHYSRGEMTITLQDVQMILGLRIDGPAITDEYRRDLPNVPRADRMERLLQLCEALLGARPETSDYTRKETTDIKVSWLKNKFFPPNQTTEVSDTPPNVVAMRRARAYILILLGTCLCSSAGGAGVPLEYLNFLGDFDQTSQYSWASAVLSYTYRGLCNWVRSRGTYMQGCGVLLQVWFWEHIGVGKPFIKVLPTESTPIGCWYCGAKSYLENPKSNSRHYYRDAVKPLPTDGIIWNPWTPEKCNRTPSICRDNSHLAMVCLPLIHFYCVEWTFPERCLRQFDLQQPIPLQWGDRDEWINLHTVDTWHKHPDKPWYVEHEKYVKLWNDRHANFIPPNPRGVSEMEYMAWYNKITLSGVHHNPPPRSADQDADVLIRPGYFQELGNTNQVWLKNSMIAIRKIRKVMAMLSGSKKQDLQDCLNAFREGFVSAGELSAFQQIMEEPLEECDSEMAAPILSLTL